MKQTNIENFLLVQAFYASLRNKTSDTTAAILKHVSVDAVDFEVFDMFCDELHYLILTLRKNGMTNWVVELAMCAGEWDVVNTELTTCCDRSILDDVIVRAASVEEWDLVQSLMNRCSQTSKVLMKPLEEAIQQGESEYARLLLDKVDPCFARQYCLGRSLLQQAVESVADREEMVDWASVRGSPLASLLKKLATGILSRSPSIGQTLRWKELCKAASCPWSSLSTSPALPPTRNSTV